VQLRLRPFLAPLVFVAAGLFYWSTVRARSRPPEGAITPPVTRLPADAASKTPKARAANRDVTFYAVSDTHLGFVPERVHAHLLKTLQATEGRSYPAEIGGVVGKPRGLIITGDLTEHGAEAEWSRFLYFYGSTITRPSAAGLEIPVFEVVGNHDNGPGPSVSEHVAERHGGKPYTFDLDDVHFVALGEAPDENALDWLQRDLDGYEKNVPLVVYFHLPLLGPWSTDNWFAESDYKDRLAKILSGRCVSAIFHGHHHATDHYVWNGIDVYKPGAVKHNAHTFAVTHIAGDAMSVAYFDYDAQRWVWSQTKKLCP
jgi:3',5'-cyclic AMP phosphodiesterase CpdA